MTSMSVNVVHSQDAVDCNRLLLQQQYQKLKKLDREIRFATVRLYSCELEPQEMIDVSQEVVKLCIARKEEVERTRFIIEVTKTGVN